MGANDITLGIKLTADGKGLVGEVKLSRDEMDKLGQSTRNYSSEAAKLNQQNKSLAASFRATAVELAAYYAGYVSVAAAVTGYRWALEQASHMQQLDARLKVATASQAEFAKAQQGVFDIANRYGVAVDETAKTFSRLNPVIAQLGGGSATTLKIIDGLAASLKLTGATAAESSAVLLQFSQAMGSGKVGGDEFRSMMENAEPLMRAVAKEMGKTTAELRQMSEDGRLTSSVFGNALLPAIDKLSKQAADIPLGIDQAWQTLKNNMSRDFGREFTAGANTAATAIKSLSEHTQELAAAAHAGEDALIAVAKAGTLVAAGVLAAYVVKSSQALYEKAGAAIAARNATLAAAEADMVATRATLAKAQSTLSVIAVERERAVAQLASANATLAATQGMGAHSAALSAAAGAAAKKSAAVTELAALGRMQAQVSREAAVAESVLAAQTAASSTAMTGARAVIASLGGPIGAVITLLSVGATAWALFGESAKKSADTAAEAVNKIRSEAAKRGQDESGSLTAERDRLKQIQAEAFREYNAAGSASDKSAVWKKYGMDKLSDQIVAFDAEIGAIQERTANLGKTTSERLSAAGEWSKLTESLKWREKIVKESNDKMLALQQSYVDRWNAASEKDRPSLEQDQQRALSTMLEARNKELASLPNHAKAIADYQNTLAAASAKAEKDGIDRSLRIIDDGLKDSLISYDAYYKARSALQLREIESEEARIRREIANEQKALANPKSEEDKYTALGKIAQLQAELAIQEQKRFTVGINGARDLAAAYMKMGADIVSVEAEIAEMTGKSGDAASTRLAAQYGALIQLLETNGEKDAAERVRVLFGLKHADAVLKEISDKFNLEMSVISDAEKRIQIDQQAGLITEYEARQKLIELRMSEIPVLESILAKENQRGPITDKQKADLRALKLQLDSVKAAASELNRTFEYGARNAIGQYLDEATNAGRQTQTIFADAFRGAENVLANFLAHGKLSFSSLLDTLKMDLARFLAQRYVMAPIVGSFGGMMGAPGGASAGGAFNLASNAYSAYNGISGAGGYASQAGVWLDGVMGTTGSVSQASMLAAQTAAFEGSQAALLAEQTAAFGEAGAALTADAMGAGAGMAEGFLAAIPGWGLALGAGLLLAGGSGLFGDEGDAQRTGKFRAGFGASQAEGPNGEGSAYQDTAWFSSGEMRDALNQFSVALAVSENSIKKNLGLTAAQISAAEAALGQLSNTTYGFGPEHTGVAQSGAFERIQADRLAAIAGALGMTTQQLASEMSVSLDTLQSAYNDAILTDAEKLALKTAEVQAQFAKLGVAMPADIEGLKKLVAAETAAGDATKPLLRELLKIAPAFAEIKKGTDGVPAAVDSLVASLQSTLDTAKRNLESAYQSDINSRQQLAEQMGRYVQTMAGYRASLILGELGGLSPKDRLEEARRQAEDLARRGKLGDTAAMDQWQNVSTSLLQASAAFNTTSSAAYLQERDWVMENTQVMEDVASRQASIESQQVSLLSAQLAELTGIKSGVLSLADALAAVSQAKSNLATAKGADVSNWYTGIGRTADAGGLDYWNDQVIAGKDAAAVRADFETSAVNVLTVEQLYRQFAGKTGAEIDAGGMNYWTGQLASKTPQEVRRDFEASVAAVHKLPAFRDGGVASAGYYIAHENELIYSDAATRIHPADQTSALLDRISRPAANDNQETLAELKRQTGLLEGMILTLIDEGRLTREELADIRTRLDSNSDEVAQLMVVNG